MHERVLKAPGTQGTEQTWGKELLRDSSELFSHGPRLPSQPEEALVLMLYGYVGRKVGFLAGSVGLRS